MKLFSRANHYFFFRKQRQSRRLMVESGAPAEGMVLEGLRTTKILLTSTKRSITTITECHTVHFYRDRLGRYRIGDIMHTKYQGLIKRKKAISKSFFKSYRTGRQSLQDQAQCNCNRVS
jgi:hypothetical protein